MKTRLLKELHLLLLPGCIMAVSAALILFREFATAESALGRFSSFIFGFAMVGLVLSIVLTAALPFGSEFQQRTLGVLLSQPLPRICIWREKLLAAVAYVVPVCLVLCSVIVATGIFQEPNRPPLSLLMLFVAAVVCSGGFWTMTARSTIGGAAFTMMGIALMFSGTWYVVVKLGAEPKFTPAVSTVAVIYSLVCLWLGWRRFARMEARDVLGGEDIALPQRFPGAKVLASVLRARAQQPVRNMIRKELRLQKPLVFLVAIFVGCWLLTYLVLMFDPTRKGFCEVAFNLLTAFYVPLVLLLAGCIPLGEETSLGAHVWHLTLPPPARRQWLIKVAVSMATAVMLGIVVPYAMALLVSARTEVGLLALESSGGMWLISMLVIFMFGFWAATLTGNTVRAALMTVAISVALVLVMSCAMSLTRGSSGILSLPVLHLLSALRASPHWIDELLPEISMLGFAATGGFALWQSREWFQRCPQGRLILRSLPLLTLAFFVHYVARDVQLSAETSRDVLHRGLVPYLEKIEVPRVGSTRQFTVAELDPTKSLPPVIRRWLDGSIISIYSMAGQRTAYSVTVSFARNTRQPSTSWIMVR